MLQGQSHFVCMLQVSLGQAYSVLIELGQPAGHDMTVYAVKWNNIRTRIFLSASADWTLKCGREITPGRSCRST